MKKLLYVVCMVSISTTLMGELLKIDGTIDPSFNNGTGFNLLQGTQNGLGLVLDKLGRIVVTGQSGFNTMVGRSLPDGTVDLLFGGNGTGFNTIPGTNDGRAVVLDRQGRIVVIGSAPGLIVDRFLSDGTLDTSFNGTGFTTLPVTLLGRDLEIDSQGRIVVVGRGGAGNELLVARFLPDGTLDTSFNGTGIHILLGTTEGMGVVLDSQGRIVVTGQSAGPADLLVARFLSDGTLDPSFNGTGFTTVLNTTQGNDLVIDKQGRIIVGGLGAAITDLLVARFLADGTLDTSFGGNNTGLNTVNVAGGGLAGEQGLRGVALDSQGRIVATGANAGTTSLVIARFTSDGLRDNTLGGEGFTLSNPQGGTFTSSEGLVLDSQGRVLVVGSIIDGGVFGAYVARFFEEEFGVACALAIREKYCPLLR